MQWHLDPYESIGPLAFGVTRAEVEAALGAPRLVEKNRGGETDLFYEELRVGLGASDGRLAEVGLFPSATVIVDGVDVFTDPSALRTLAERDGGPQALVGFVILLRYGVTLTGMHDGDRSQLAVTAFARGRWDRMRSRMRPFTIR